jgi:ribose 5-phosphate isomerase RpiB
MAGGGANTRQRAAIERLVRQVIAELQAGAKQTAASGELVLSGRVVTLADVEGRLNGVTRVVVERGAVFTPSARDELRHKGVTIASAVRPAKRLQNRRVAIAVSETRFEPAALVAALATEKIEIERLPNVGLVMVVDEMCDTVVKSGIPGVLLTERAAGALCLANRQRGVRAALATNASAVSEVLRDVAANLLVVDPRGKSTFELRQIVRQLVHHSGACPTDLAARLG